MKLPYLLLGIVLFLMVTFISCEDRRVKFAENIKKNIKNLYMPSGTQNLVNNFDNKLTLLFNTVSQDKLTELQSKFDLSDSLTQQIKSAPYARVSASLKIIEDHKKTRFYSYERSLGAAIREDDGNITFALLKTKTFANLKVRYTFYDTRECHRVLIFFKKCETVWHKKEKSLTDAEKIQIGKAAEYTAAKSLYDAVEILKKGDYELYMSDTGTIFSPDHRSAAYVTNFGDIAIGPVSELNVFYPLKYDYVESFNFASKSKQIIKRLPRKFIKQTNYPKTKNTQPDDLVLADGFYHKFNFIRKSCQSKFPRTYTYFNTETSTNNKGPYILEVKKNGNIVLYLKKTGNIVWQSYTANKGAGPYDLRLTNERKLILEDSTGKIIYQSKDYKETPTIWYSFGGGFRAYNGLISNKFESIYVQYRGKPGYYTNANILDIYTDNDSKYTVTYSGRIKGTKSWFIHNNKRSQVNYDYTHKSRKRSNMDAFKITLSGASGYDICYTAYTNEKKWTNVACNGNLVVARVGTYFTNLIIYVKETSESLPGTFY